jgi:hypothetical protein
MRSMTARSQIERQGPCANAFSCRAYGCNAAVPGQPTYGGVGKNAGQEDVRLKAKLQESPPNSDAQHGVPAPAAPKFSYSVDQDRQYLPQPHPRAPLPAYKLRRNRRIQGTYLWKDDLKGFKQVMQPIELVFYSSITHYVRRSRGRGR